jgi:predicted N-formylglutamate amidohydrolase
MSSPYFEVRRSSSRGPYLIVCDHASNFIPEQLRNLGLTQADLQRHIAWDIGAAGVAELLSERFDSPAVFSGASRLVVDCNRHPDAIDLIPEISDGTIVPGNWQIGEAEKEERRKRYFEPYHDAIDQLLKGRPQAIFLSVHSMTECLKGELRPWAISLSSFEDRSLVNPLLEALGSSNEFSVGDNQPYNLDPKVDYSTPSHAIRRGLRHLQVEFRQDEIGTAAGQKLWAERFAMALERSRARASPA